MSVNKVILVGRLGTDPESRSFSNGGSVCNLRIATSESWKDKQTGERQERTEWHRVTLNGKLGEIAQQYLTKGSQVYIEGRIQTRKWQNQQGQDQYSTEIVGREMTMLGGGGQAGQSQQSSVLRQQPQSSQAGTDYGGGDYFKDDVPFAQHMRGTVV